VTRRAIGLLLCAIFLGQGLFIGGVLPVVHAYLPEHASLTYALYYAGLVLGQLLIMKVPALSMKRWVYPCYEAAFGASIVVIGAGFSFAPWNVVFGRLGEGLAAGLALPLGFTYAAKVESFGSSKQRVAVFNSCFAIGLVAGPAVVTQLLRTTAAPGLLMGFGVGFGALALTLLPLLQGVPAPSEWPAPAEAASREERWLDVSFTLFLAKTFYGFLLTFLAAGLIDELKPLSVSWAMVCFSAVFVAGQAVSPALSRAVPVERLRVALPLLLAGALGLAWGLGAMPFLFGAALLHSMLLFVGYDGASSQPGNAAAFARANVTSDPGMLVGAALAGLGWPGCLVIMALCAVPLGRRR
jgi:MFS family permease